MATAVSGEVKDTERSICYEEFTDLKLLFCGHLSCRHCLLSWVISSQNAPCPLCRCAIVDPEARQHQTLESIVDAFPTDVAMEILVENERLLKKDHACQSCQTQKATSLCMQCRDFLCTACVAMHGRLSLTRDHDVESLSSLTAEKLAVGSSAPCGQHPKELCRLYCATHHVFICNLCASSKHRNCPEVKDLEKQKEETHVQFTEVVTRLSDHETKLSHIIRGLDDALQETEKKEQTAMSKVSEIFIRLESLVKKSRHQMEVSARSKFAETKELIRDRRAQVLQRRSSVTAYRAVAERGRSVSLLGDIIDMAYALKKHVDCIEISDQQLTADVEVITVPTLEISPNVVSNAEKALLKLDKVKFQSTLPAVAQSQKPVPFCFHDNCGENIVLSNNNCTAETKGSEMFGGIVVSRQRMVPHRLYEVRSHVGDKLRSLPKGSRVGVMVDGDRRLHLYIDGEHQGHAKVQLSQPCFAFFDFFGWNKKITTQPVRVIR